MSDLSSFSIRSATRDDNGTLADIHGASLAKATPSVSGRYQANKETMLDQFSYDMRSLFQDPYKRIDMACVDDVPKAFVVYDVPEDAPHASAELLYNASPDYSLGAILLDHVKTVAQHHGKEGLLLNGVVPDAHSVYAGMGFTQDPDLHSARHMMCRVNDTLTIKRDHPLRAVS